MPPTLEEDGWELESALARHLASPATFQIPSEHERRSLRVGTMVKLLFLLRGQDDAGSYQQCERMWVTITRAEGGEYTGSLESLPVTSAVLAPGDKIHFKPEHVATIFVRRSGLLARVRSFLESRKK